MTATPYLEGASGDPSLTKRMIAPQWTREVPPDESAFMDYRDNGGPITIENSEITRQIIAPDGEPEDNLRGKRNINAGPLAIGDVDPANPGYLLAKVNVAGSYTFQANTPVSGVNRWTIGRNQDSEAPDFLALIEDDDRLPRKRVKDLSFGGFNIGATPNGNYAATFPLVVNQLDFFGAPEQTEGGAAAQAITSITRVSTTATVTTAAPHGLSTGDVVVVSGASETEYNVEAIITRLSATTFSYTVAGTPATPATGSPVYATNGLSITGITRTSGTATATTATAHGLETGDKVRVAGAGQAGYNLDATITVTGASTFTYPVDSGTVTPATGTIVYERLDADVPIVEGLWDKALDDDDADEDLYVEVTAFDGVNTYTLKAKIGSAASFSSSFTAKRGLNSSALPIWTRMKDETGADVGTWAEPVKIHLPTDGNFPIGATYKYPKRRADWTQVLADAKPISSVETSFWLTNEDDELEETRADGGIQMVGAYPTNERRPDTPGVQGAIIDRRGTFMVTATPTRRITNLRLQKAVIRNEDMWLVFDSKTSVNIGMTARPFRDLHVIHVRAWGPTVGVGPGATNNDEAPTLRSSRPTAPFTYDGMTFSDAYTHVIENDLPESIVTVGKPS